MAVADFTGDGRPDVVTAASRSSNPATENTVLLFAQQSDGTLAAPVFHDTSGIWTRHLSAGDLNGDGKADVAVAGGEEVDIFFQGSGTLLPAQTIEVAYSPDNVEIADADEDGDRDIFVAGNGVVELFRNDGTGSVTGFSIEQIGEDGYTEMEVGDLDGDGRVDLVASTRSSNIHIQYQLTDGSFGPAVIHTFPDSVGGIEAADVTGDGRVDVIATVRSGTPKIHVLPQNSGGALGPAAQYNAYESPAAVEAGDLNKDGLLDLVVTHWGWHAMSVYRQRSDGTLTKKTVYDSTYGNYDPKSVAIGDLSGDGLVDLALADQEPAGLLVFRQGKQGSLSIDVSKSKVAYKGSVTVTGHLGPHAKSPNREVKIYARPAGDSKVLVASGPVNASGDLSVVVKLFKNTTFTLEWEGDRSFLPGKSEGARVEVRVKTTGELRGHQGKSGKYHLYALGVDPLYVGKVVPILKGKPLRFRMQSKTGGSWKKLAKDSFKMGAKGQVKVLVNGDLLKEGPDYRIRAEFVSTTQYLGDNSPWSYFRMT